jgi:hypothetical protein
MPVDRGKPTGIAVMGGWYEKAAEWTISGLLSAVASNRIAWPDEPSTQVLFLGKSVLRLLSGPACWSRLFVRVTLLLAGS